jgi:hypothetical protein
MMERKSGPGRGRETLAGRPERAATGPVAMPLGLQPITGAGRAGGPDPTRRRGRWGSMRTADVAAADALLAQALARPTIKEVTRK